MKILSLLACTLLGAASVMTAAPAHAQLMMLTSCNELDEQARVADNGFFPAQEAKVKVRRAYFHSGPAPRCQDRKTFVIRDDYVSAQYRVDGWIYATFVNREGDDVSAWFQERDLQLIGAYGDIDARGETSSASDESQ